MTNATACLRAAIGIAGGVAICLLTNGAAASPKGYDIEALLRQDLPSWRQSSGPAAPPPQARPLQRLPSPPPPVYTQPPSAAPAVAAPILPPVVLPTAPPAMPTATPAAGRRVIRTTEAPRSTVSGAWSPGN